MNRAGLLLVIALCAGCPGTGPAGGESGPTEPGPSAPGSPGQRPGVADGAPGGAAPAPPAVDLAAVEDGLLEQWVGAALRLPRQAFVPARRSPELNDRLFRYLAQSSAATDLFLQPAVDPHQAGQASWTVHAAADGTGLDLLRCEFASAEGKAVLLEGVNFLLLQLEARPGLDGRELEALLARVVRLDLELEEGRPTRDWRFDIPAGLDLSRGTWCFTSRGAVPVANLEDRHQRADVIVREGRVAVVFYKKVDQLACFQDGARWFDPDARRTIGS